MEAITLELDAADSVFWGEIDGTGETDETSPSGLSAGVPEKRKHQIMFMA